MMDCQCITELLRHGLLPGSHVPPLLVRDLRDLTRTRNHAFAGTVQNQQPHPEVVGQRQHQTYPMRDRLIALDCSRHGQSRPVSLARCCPWCG
jgi:hypothetical protein